MRTYLKTLGRMFTKHVTRFISIIFIVLVAVGFISGIGTSADKIRYSLADHYRERNVSDLIVRSTSESGFSGEKFQEKIAKLRDIYGENNVNTGAQVDAKVKIGGEEQSVRLYFLDGFSEETWTVNVPEFLNGSTYPAETAEALSERADNKIKGVETGTEITLDFKAILTELATRNLEEGETLDEETANKLNMLGYLPESMRVRTVKVTGEVQGPLTFAQDGELSDYNGTIDEFPKTIGEVNALETLDNVLYLSSSVVPNVMGNVLLPANTFYISFKDKTKFNPVFSFTDPYFGKAYDDCLNEQEQTVLETLEITADEALILSLYKNYSFSSLDAYADKVMGIGLVLMVAFLFVTALVVLSNMTRLMEEERGQIACLRTLGYSSFKIIFKYLLFAMIATGIGGVASYFVGLGLAYLICYVFNYSFSMPPISTQVALPFFLIVFFVIVATTLAATLIAGHKMTAETPANLLRPKPPKEGKKVFLERMPFLWNRLSFKYKSTTRNVLRYLNRFIMTVVSVAVSTALVMAGFALLDVCLFGGIDSPSVMAIAVVVIVFAGLLTMAVVYTLTNINVSERNRELATLKVLGYHEKEVSGYIFREVYIDTVVGIIFGFPLSLPIMLLLFSIMEVGSLATVSWFWWLAAPFVVLLFTFIVTLALRRKIVKIDMNESQKAIE